MTLRALKQRLDRNLLTDKIFVQFIEHFPQDNEGIWEKYYRFKTNYELYREFKAQTNAVQPPANNPQLQFFNQIFDPPVDPPGNNEEEENDDDADADGGENDGVGNTDEEEEQQEGQQQGQQQQQQHGEQEEEETGKKKKK